MHWPDRRVLDLLGADVPIIQAPMAGITTPAMIQGVARAGGLGSLPLGMATPDGAQAALDALATWRARLSTSTSSATSLSLMIPSQTMNGGIGWKSISSKWACPARHSRQNGMIAASAAGSANWSSAFGRKW
jgi:NAD(P)H-dependent flavin oxidoreductase YrpB (nitropropane dioxygenase family)